MSEVETDSSIKKFLESRRAFILEPSRTFSKVLQQILARFGMPQDSIKTGRFAEAVEAIESGVEIIISEYQIKNRFGIELATLQKKIQKNFSERVFIITTSNASETAVAEAAEEDVDGYILKPFSPGQFESSFRKIILSKLTPSDYWQYLQEGQEHIEKGQIEDAMHSFEAAEKFSEKPSLACYYQGFTHVAKSEIEKALVDYQRGLNVNSIHYKCLQGQFEILFKLEKRNKAYEVATVIKNHFPITPQRLANFFMLAVYTHNFEDLTSYFETFESYENRPPELSRLISAGMMAAGRYAKKSGDDELAFDYMQKSQWALPSDLGLLEKIIKYFLLTDDHEHAEFFLAKIPADKIGSGFHLRLEYLVNGHLYRVDESIKKAKKIIKLGDLCVEFFTQAIQQMVQAKKMVVAEDFVGGAVSAFPDRRAEFNELLEVNPSADSTESADSEDDSSLSSEDKSSTESSKEKK